MSLSLNKTIAFFIPLKKCENLFIKEKIEDIWELEISRAQVIERVETLLYKEPGVLSLSAAEIKDVEYSLLNPLKDEVNKNKDYEEFVCSTYSFDNTLGYQFTTVKDNESSRYKHNVDWYLGVDKCEFEAVVIPSSIHLGKPCLAKVVKGQLEIFYEDELKVIYSEKTGKDYRELSRTEFYKAMKKLGFKNYVNPSYFILAKVGDVLLPGVTRKDFEKCGKLSVLTIWG